jgi:VIT1/CCC1 family predicted Fe2+/Mn2+ transporter
MSPSSRAASPAAEEEALALRLVSAIDKRPLDPVDRYSEIIFGRVMGLTFTGTLRVADSGREEVREMLVAALGCNVAWGVVDGVMYVVTSVVDRARRIAVFRGIRAAGPAGARAIVLAALPPGVAAVTDEADADRMAARARTVPELPIRAGIQADDLRGALAACLLTVAATLPPTLPFLFIPDVRRALLVSNAVAVGSLFFAGYGLGKATGVRAWILGIAMVLVGAALVGVTIALGG